MSVGLALCVRACLGAMLCSLWLLGGVLIADGESFPAFICVFIGALIQVVRDEFVVFLQDAE